MVILMEFGESIKKFRKAAGLTQKQLAEMIGAAEITIRQYENNKRNPSWRQMTAIAKALNVPFEELLGFIVAYKNQLTDEEIAENDRLATIEFEKANEAEREKRIIATGISQKIRGACDTGKISISALTRIDSVINVLMALSEERQEDVLSYSRFLYQKNGD